MIEPGQSLGKYELIEKVGQGGMAVVYRGRDRSLKRVVAIKVLHRHLADHKEARDRFEREAQAVAKLRHENILEIFDYSGDESDESYIVTEFIEGETLKDFIRAHAISFPEVGAMICAQVCRALAHAHGLGILHRDVKPENIMIRSDGVVKLTDFGIAQMLDTQRLTVTGQLLGSPAYMSPEHVEGGQLDFRTDVFSVGILLYQLITGELPFSGRNPHEILKRIADCNFKDPRELSPRVGKELAAIVTRSMAREKDDRYADVSHLLQALETYLSGSGLNDTAAELRRFFAAPAAYEMALRERLIAHLSARGREVLEENRAAGLELFNRVLTIDPDNADVLAVIDRLSRRKRGVRLVMLAAAVVALSGAAFATRDLWRGGAAPLAKVVPAAPDAAPAGELIEPPPDAAPQVVLATADAAPVAEVPPDGAPRVAIKRPPRGRPDAGPTAREPATRSFVLTVTRPREWKYRVDNGPEATVRARNVTVTVGPGRHVIEVFNDVCCVAETRVIGAGDPGGALEPIVLSFASGQVTPRCPGADNVNVYIDGKLARLDRPWPISISSVQGTEKVRVEFRDENGNLIGKQKTPTVRYKQEITVECDS